MSEWIKHDGKGIPVRDECMVSVIFRGDEYNKDKNVALVRRNTAGFYHHELEDASCWIWSEKTPDEDIIEYIINPERYVG